MTFLTTYAFTENGREIPGCLSTLSYFIYGFTGFLFLTGFCISRGWCDNSEDEIDVENLYLLVFFGIPILLSYLFTYSNAGFNDSLFSF